MLKQEMGNRSQMEFFCIDQFVPQKHLLRKIDKAVDFDHIYELVEDLYCPDNGRPSCDPVVLFKMVIIQHLYGIPSHGMRYTLVRGLSQVRKWVRLKFAAMNIKKFALHVT